MSMDKITVNLKNCYGIRSLSTVFDFKKSNVIAIYAPNGVMKSSLAQTFRDHANDVPSEDRIFPSRDTAREVIDADRVSLVGSSILVVEPYDQKLGLSEQTSILLVDANLRKEYEQIHARVNDKKAEFIKAIKKQSRSKRDIEREISLAFTPHQDQFFRALVRTQSEVESQDETPLCDIQYDRVFDEAALALLEEPDFNALIKDYVERYNSLLDESRFFSRETFSYFNAETIARNLAKNGFFEARHSVNLNGLETVEVSTEKQLLDLVLAEKQSIADDQELRQKFLQIEKRLKKNAPSRSFEEYLSENEVLLPRLANIKALKEEIWKSYFKAHLPLYHELLEQYNASLERSKQIELEAQRQRTQWEEVIDIFNARFVVPFKLGLRNRERIILGSDSLPQLGFEFDEGSGEDPVKVDRETLMATLSTGEKKALYILNLLFEIEARKKTNQDTLLVFDDIADSFDYRNKYAIIQYLSDIAQVPQFKLLILTHNFDFFRSAHRLLSIPYPQCKISEKSTDSISFVQASGIKNPFVLDWKNEFFTDSRKRWASIPFLRNLIEYTKGSVNDDYKKLTSLLHWRPDSARITQNEVDEIFKRLFDSDQTHISPQESVMATIMDSAESCITHPDSSTSGIEGKVVLSIAVRVLAEKFMVKKIDDRDYWHSIQANQMRGLSRKYCELYQNDVSTISILNRVALMTPETIHLNSFMYEPIWDMSSEHLVKLFNDVKELGRE